MPIAPNSLKQHRIKMKKHQPVSFTLTVPDKDVCREMVLKHHYSGRCPGIKYCYGVEENATLVGIVIYSVPASYTLCNGVCGKEYRTQVLELARLVIITKTPNAASFLVGGSLAALPDHVVVSYADCNDHVGHVGYIYQATNWVYTGHGNSEPVWVHPTTGEVISYTRRHIDDKARKHGLEWTDLHRRKQLGKHRYVYFTGSKKFRKAAATDLKYPRLPYPKGTTRRHDVCAMEVVEYPDQPTITTQSLGTPPPVKPLRIKPCP